MTNSDTTLVPSSARQTFRVVFVAATLMGLVSTLQSWLYGPLMGQPMGLGLSILAGFPNAYFWVAVTPLVLWLGRRFPFGGRPSLQTLAVHLLALFTLLIPYAMLVAFPAWAWGRDNGERAAFGVWILTVGLSSRMALGLVIYFGILGIYQAVETVRRLESRRAEAARLEAQLMRAQLQALQMQMHPHFLFNALQAIRTLVDEDPAAARRAVTLLGDLLRLTLAHAESQVVPLRRELEFLQPYLEIQRIRFADRLHVEVDVNQDLLESPVPSFVLQPLVENAIKYGIAPRREPGRVAIRVRRENGDLLMSVLNDGPPLSREAREGGIGLRATRTRLSQLYGEAASFVLRDDPAGGVRAELRIPLPHG